MDAVEIVMAVEEAFDIRIDDAEAEKAETPGHLIELVLSKTQIATSNVCLTHRAFNLVRGAIIRRCAFARKQVRPDTPLRTTFSQPVRRAQLKQLALDLAISRPPDLVRPTWLRDSIVAVAFLAGAATPLATWKLMNFPGILATALATAVATACIEVIATRAFAIDFPRNLETIGDLARWVMGHKADLATPQTSAWTRAQVAARVREIVVNSLGCESSYREDARFVKDLGMG